MSISEPITREPEVETNVLRFTGGLPGFPGLERFALAQWGDGSSPFSVMQSLEDVDLSFVVMPPALFFPEYEPEINNDTALELGLTTAEDAMLLVIVTVRSPVVQSTANLLGPLVVNVHDLHGVQAVLDPDRYSAAAPLAAPSPDA